MIVFRSILDKDGSNSLDQKELKAMMIDMFEAAKVIRSDNSSVLYSALTLNLCFQKEVPEKVKDDCLKKGIEN